MPEMTGSMIFKAELSDSMKSSNFSDEGNRELDQNAIISKSTLKRQPSRLQSSSKKIYSGETKLGQNKNRQQ